MKNTNLVDSRGFQLYQFEIDQLIRMQSLVVLRPAIPERPSSSYTAYIHSPSTFHLLNQKNEVVGYIEAMPLGPIFVKEPWANVSLYSTTSGHEFEFIDEGVMYSDGYVMCTSLKDSMYDHKLRVVPNVIKMRRARSLVHSANARLFAEISRIRCLPIQDAVDVFAPRMGIGYKQLVRICYDFIDRVNTWSFAHPISKTCHTEGDAYKRYWDKYNKKPYLKYDENPLVFTYELNNFIDKSNWKDEYRWTLYRKRSTSH